jgi:hypothetical protein
MLIVNTPELEANNVIKTYSCGSPNLKDFLIKNGVFPIYQYKHVHTKRFIWVFIECEDLSVLLSQWTKNKPKKGGEKNE